MMDADDDYELELALTMSKGDDFSMKLDDDLDYAFAISLKSEFNDEDLEVLDIPKSNHEQLYSKSDKPLNRIENDSDYAFALSLQSEFDGETKKSPECSTSTTVPNDYRKKGSETPLSIVDDQWETLDPVPDIHSLFLQFNKNYFEGKLAGVEVRWSPRMTLCAGICCYEGRGGLCSVRLSQPLLKFRPRRDLVETLLHEMIHAYLFVTHNNKDHDAHGPEFLNHMNRINNKTGTKISVYHSFHDEVDVHRKHWWKCNGPCKSRRPFYGLVKRAMNRAPSPRDPWWADHQAKCGGTFIKIKEPEDYGKKKATKRKHNVTNSNEKVLLQDIQKYFSPNAFGNKASTEKKGFQTKTTGIHTFLTSDQKAGGQVIPFSDKGHRLGGEGGTPPNRNLPNSTLLQKDLFNAPKYSSPNLKLGNQKPGSSTQGHVRPKGSDKGITPRYQGSSMGGSNTVSRNRGARTIVLNDKGKSKATAKKPQNAGNPVAYFTGTGHVLGSSVTAGRTIKVEGEKSKSPPTRQESIETFLGNKTPKTEPVNKKRAVIFSSDSEDETLLNSASGDSSNEHSEQVPCPVCGMLIKEQAINQHLDICLSNS